MSVDVLSKLAKQAGLHDEWYIDNPEIEKFAELLIEKCTSILSTIDRAQLRSGEYVDPADMIKQHFGVKE